MENLDVNVGWALSNEELIEITGGDPFMKDLGRFLGKIGGRIVNAITEGTQDQWMLDVDPKLLFG
ncbi:MAG: hypothetical protein H6545_04300 [Bacteroidales bacterium]|jgi:hypothetical protein|nr:hypothetical protein [Bacteroidales bacterium]HPE21782.1 hypothetical protein [Bacteroidales bacterium]HPJ05524.1 hypothetical protein [Bacteroidales bacterium]HPQ63741.1 hypothetical protein [Bacteroidales bacterium]HRW26818.1 hypothetical protein [Bacteroidales bacterium]